MKRLLLLSCLICQFASAAQTEKSLQLIAEQYKHLLKLDDWAVYIHLVRLEDLREGTSGSSSRRDEYKMARIEVLDSKDYSKLEEHEHLNKKSSKEIERDQINTVVHELVHLRLADLTNGLVPSDDEKAAEEIVVVRITSALLRERVIH